MVKAKEITLTPSQKIAVVTDSAAGMPPELCEAHNIHVVPYFVHLGEESYISGVDMQPEEFFQRVRSDPELSV